MSTHRCPSSQAGLRRLTPWAFALLLTPAATAQPAFQVADLNTSRESFSFATFLSGPFGSLDGALYFPAEDGIHGIELWKTDGSVAGASMVRDICPGACGGSPVGMQRLGDRLLFYADDGTHGSELWVTDGTLEGTMLVRDVHPGLAGSTAGFWILPAGDRAFLGVDDGLHGAELWVTDGTPGGTQLVADLNPGPAGSAPEPTLTWNGLAVLSVDDGLHGREPWLTDGTVEGTRLLKDVNPGPAGSLQPSSRWALFPTWLATSWGPLLFVADDGTHGQELWASDGTEHGTVLLQDAMPGATGGSAHSLTEWAGAAYYTGRDPAAGKELWRTDGTPQGTMRVADINPGAEGSNPLTLTAAGGRLFFYASDPQHGYELWATDGTAAGTALVRDIRPGTDGSWAFYLPMQEINGRLLFFAIDGNGGEVWTSDGSEPGTVQVSTMSPDASLTWYRPYLQRIGDQFYFMAVDAAGDVDIWATNGLPGGTRRVVDPRTQTSAFYHEPLSGNLADSEAWKGFGGRLFFAADDGITGNNPWITDGSPAGTLQLGDAIPADTSPFNVGPLVDLGTGRALFAPGTLWETDGTQAGTAPLFAAGGPEVWQPMQRLGDAVFFSGSTPATGSELWKTDGTAAGTALITDLRPGNASSAPGQLTATKDTLFFTAYTDAVGGDQELWKSDGSQAGTVRVRDIQPGLASSSPDHLTPLERRLFFAADDGASGREPWVSDGTEAGTFRLRDIAPGPDSSIVSSTYERFAVVGSTFFFPAADGAGEELWATDGTPAGTRRVRDVRPGPLGSEPRWLTAAGDRLFFAADDGVQGRELWVSDGTEAGTLLAADLLPGSASGLPRDLAAVGSTVIFSATDGVHGVEPWAGDGTWTRRLADIAPGALPSSPAGFFPLGPLVYFAATDAVTGFELWALPKTALAGPLDFYTVPPCRLADTRPATALPHGVRRTVSATGTCGIPPEARALVVNLTVVAPTGPGDLVAWPAGSPLPETTNLTFPAGALRSAYGLVELSEDGAIDLQSRSTTAGQVHVVVDVTGYYRGGTGPTAAARRSSP